MRTKLTGNHGIMLYSSDLQAAADWYVKHLGATLGPHSYDDFVELHVNERNVLHIFKAEPAPVMSHPFFSLNTHDAEALHQALGAAGIDISALVRRVDHVEFIVSDLNGNRYYLTEWL